MSLYHQVVTLMASRDVPKTNSFCIFCYSLWQFEFSSFDRDYKSCVCSSSMLSRGSFENCESGNKNVHW